MPQYNLFTEVSTATKENPNTNMRALTQLYDINSITDAANGLLAGVDDAGKRARRIEYFYDKMLLDTIKLGSEENVLLKYCEVKTVPQGNEKFLLRRWGGLTEHTVPLEGVPPKSDRMASESFEGTYCQYGRYMEFTDRVDFSLIDDVIAHYSMELGDVAVRMAERLCREELIANAGITYANEKTFADLVIGDTVGIEDYRLQALKFARRMVKPLAGGNYVVICSPEHIDDLVDDPLVEKYMDYTNTAEPLTTGKPVKLFNITFEQTMLDDYAYGYTEVSNPGEYDTIEGNTVKHNLRLVVISNGVDHYINLPEASTTSLTGIKRDVKDTILKDGSYIPNKVTWDLAGFKALLVSGATLPVKKADGSSASLTGTALTTAEVYQLPVHRSFMFGKEFIYKTGIDGRMNAKFFVKEKGSAGVLDPIDQRQSVGFKIDTLGFNTVRPEAMVQFVFVPKQALTTYKEVIDEYDIHYNEQRHVHHEGKMPSFDDANLEAKY